MTIAYVEKDVENARGMIPHVFDDGDDEIEYPTT
jgi:hypothetical protein